VLTAQDIIHTKGQRKLSVLTAYDYSTAKIFDAAEIDMLLVGDSLGMVILGYPNTQDVLLEDMIRHGAAVVRGAPASFVVVDMPIHSTDTFEIAFKNCRTVLDATHAQALKIEGQVEVVSQLVKKGIMIMGHTGLKPQTAFRYGVQGKDQRDADRIFEEALELEKAGVFSLILECVPFTLAEKITKALKIPVIGIGAGNCCDGQVLVSSDMLGFYTDFKPKFVRRYGDLGSQIKDAALQFKNDVEAGLFPSEAETFF